MKTEFPNNLNGSSLPPPDHWRYRIEGSQKAFFASAPHTSRIGYSPSALCVYLASKESGTKYQPPYVPTPLTLFRRYLGRYLISPVPVRLSHSYLEKLAVAAAPSRPNLRKARTVISKAPGLAELLPDLALCLGQDTILVEIKPKSGVLSRSALVDPIVAETLRKFWVPTYYLKKYLLPDDIEGIGKLPEPHQRFNPVDLLSGKNVLQQLLILHYEGSAGLRMFRRGNAVTHNGSKSVSKCNGGLCTTVLDVTSRVLMNAQGGQKNFLTCLRDIQDKDHIDNLGASVLFKRLVKEVGRNHAQKMIERYLYDGGEDGKDTAKDEDAFQAAKRKVSYQSVEEARETHCMETYARALEEAMRMELQHVARLLAEFLQAAVAKDCSVMISMCLEANCVIPTSELLESERDCGVVCVSGHRWVYVVHVVDVGAKSLNKIEDKWAPVDIKRVSRIAAAGGLPEIK